MNVLVEVSDFVATVTLNRPQAMNALSAALRADLARAMAELGADANVRAIVLTGAGERAFSAGLDLKELGADPAGMAAANATGLEQNPCLAVERCGKPVVGAINGAAITGGFELALACTVLIASTNARFADTHARVGILPGWGLSAKLSRAIGLYRAREMALTGNFIDAATAAAWGLVSRVVPQAELIPAARQIAADMASIEPEVLSAYRRLIEEGFAVDFGVALALEGRVSSAWNAAVTPEQVEARREAVRARGRAQG